MRCARCNAELPARAVEGMCPVCLLETALSDDAMEAGGGEFRYDLIEEIGRGGMGVVYRAMQHGSQRQVAVKMILAEQAATPGMMERFHAEAEAIAALDHPHILPIYETGETAGMPFYSMKLARGGTLRAAAPNFRRRPRETARLLATIARAVHHAHQRGILHRDLKPGNILLDGEADTPFVSDFGLAKWLTRENRLTIASNVLGTPHYIAPEQASGASANLTTAADVYSLGAILYELLTGRPPFVADTPLETIRLVIETEAASPRTLEVTVPADLDVICSKCLAKDPSARYGSAAALADDLERWLEGRTILARPAKAPERLLRWARRNRALAALTLALLGLLVAVAIGSTITAARLRISNDRARAAEHRAREELRTASVAQARATRLTGRLGQRFDALAALKNAAAIRPGADLRTEAFAALMLPDIRVERTWKDRLASNSPAAFAATLERYVVETDAGVLSLRRTADQTEIARLPTPDKDSRVLYLCAFSADDSAVAARYATDAIRVYDTTTGKVLYGVDGLHTPKNSRAFDYSFGFTPDSRELIVSAPEGGVSFHDFRSGRETGRLLSSTVPVIVAVSPDGKKIALAGQRSATVEIYDRASSALEQRLEHPSFLYHLAWRPGASSQLLTACNDTNLYLWDTTNARQLRVLKGHTGIPTLVAFHPDGKMAASASRDFSVRLWDVETGDCLLNGHGLYGEPCLRFSSDGRHLALGGEGRGISVATLARDEPCREIFRCDSSDWYSRISGMTVSRDGRLLAIALRAGGIQLLSVETGARLAALPIATGERKTACFTPKGDALITSDPAGLTRRSLRWKDNGTLELGEAELIDRRPHYLVTDVQGDPPVSALYSEAAGQFSVINFAEPERPIDLKVRSTPAGAFLTPDLRFVVTNDWEGEVKGESDVRVWDAKTGGLLRRLDSGPNNSVRLSPSGRLLVACGSGAGAGLWRLPDFTRGPSLPAAGDDAWFTPDEKTIAILNNDNLDLVRIADGSLIGSFLGDPALAVAFTPNGRKMFLGYGSRFLEWDLSAVHRELGSIDLDWEDPVR